MAESPIPVQVPAESYAPDTRSKNPAPGQYTQSPLLFPNVGVPSVSNGMVTLESTRGMLVAFPRVAATAAGLVGGSFAAGHSIVLTFTNPAFPAGSIAVDYTTVTGDTDAAILADHLAGAVNGSAACQAYGVSASTDGAGNITFSQPGPVANFTVVSFSSTGSETLTLTPASGDMSGGSGAVLPWKDFSISVAGQQLWFRTGQPQAVPPNVLRVLVNEGHPVA